MPPFHLPNKLTSWVNSITFSDIFNVLHRRSVTYTDERRLAMKNSITSKDSSLSRRDFAILGIGGSQAQSQAPRSQYSMHSAIRRRSKQSLALK